MDFTALYCEIDDFYQEIEPLGQQKQIEGGQRRRQRRGRMAPSEIMTILIGFQDSHYRTFKHYYFALQHTHRGDFPTLLSYSRFVEVTASVIVPLLAFLLSRTGQCTGIAFVDSTPIEVCHNKRINRNRVFKDLAQIGKSSKGWFFGFKLHLIINEQGELLATHLTPGNVDDRLPVPQMSGGLFEKLFGDKGSISASLFEELWDLGVQLITSIRKNMKNRFMSLWDKLMLRKRSLIETVNDQLKNVAQIEHTRHRSSWNFAVNIVTALISYSRQPKKPSIRLEDEEQQVIQQLAQQNTLMIA